MVDPIHRDFPLLRERRRRAQALKSVHRRGDDVLFVARAERLGEHIVDPRRRDDRTNRPASDNASTRTGRLEQNSSCAGTTNDLVRNGHPIKGHLEHILARAVIALANGFRDLVGLTEANADMTGFITHDDERRKAEAAAAFDHLGDAVDVDDALLQALFVNRIIQRHNVYLAGSLKPRQKSRPAPRAASARALMRP